MDLINGFDAIVPGIVDGLRRSGHCANQPSPHNGFMLSGQQAVQEVLRELVGILFPGCHMRREKRTGGLQETLPQALRAIGQRLQELCREAFEYECLRQDCTENDCQRCDESAVNATTELLNDLPVILETLQADIRAAYEGDPAARSTMEVVMSYPGVFAIVVHRIAHKLYGLRVPLIPRVMSEYAHSLTGIDIHPGATIGCGFFIDHGTGVVIGETCVIGSNVKLYQGVTLGALSFKKDQAGRLIKGIKRHPDVGNNVIIYAGATILGGNTCIGDHSVIGGNVWLTHSVPPHSKVYNQQPNPLIRAKDGSWETVDGPWSDPGAGI